MPNPPISAVDKLKYLWLVFETAAKRGIQVTAPNSVTLKPNDVRWPRSLNERLGAAAPSALQAIGPVALLSARKTAFFCPARAIERMRIPPVCRAAFEAGRLLFLSPFTQQPERVTQGSAMRRNEIVAALADEVFIAHIPGGETERIAELLARWRGAPGFMPERMIK